MTDLGDAIRQSLDSLADLDDGLESRVVHRDENGEVRFDVRARTIVGDSAVEVHDELDEFRTELGEPRDEPAESQDERDRSTAQETSDVGVGESVDVDTTEDDDPAVPGDGGTRP